MKVQVDLGYLNDVLQKYYTSKADMAKQLGITRSHLQEVFRNRGIGTKVLKGLKKQASEKGFSYEFCLVPEPILMGDKEIESIEVTTESGELLASITTRNVIEKEGTRVVVIPYGS